MVERRNGKSPAVRLEYSFDRLLIPKLVTGLRNSGTRKGSHHR